VCRAGCGRRVGIGDNVAQQALTLDLGATQSQLWVINGYTLTLAALLMPVGAIGDRWGRKPILLAGLVVFIVANVASGFAGSVDVLIALRVLAGVGAAMVMPVTLSVITTNFPAEEQAKAIGTGSAARWRSRRELAPREWSSQMPRVLRSSMECVRHCWSPQPSRSSPPCSPLGRVRGQQKKRNRAPTPSTTKSGSECFGPIDSRHRLEVSSTSDDLL